MTKHTLKTTRILAHAVFAVPVPRLVTTGQEAETIDHCGKETR